jgi:hypothetical protein
MDQILRKERIAASVFQASMVSSEWQQAAN